MGRHTLVALYSAGVASGHFATYQAAWKTALEWRQNRGEKIELDGICVDDLLDAAISVEPRHKRGGA